jgi:hypothetical protein
MASPGSAIAISHTKELEPGDLVRVAFAPGHLGFFKYGAEALFVVSKKTNDGGVFFSDSRSSILGPLRGTRQELVLELKKMTDFLNLQIYRPDRAVAKDAELEDESEDESEDELEDELEDEDFEVETAPVGAIGNGPPIITPPAILIVGGATVIGLMMYFSKKKKDDED